MYKIQFSPRALQDLQDLQKSEPMAYKKALKLIEEIRLHPKLGTGKPELKKYDLAGKWSRRITDKHRIIYTINHETITVIVLASKGHYHDK